MGEDQGEGGKRGKDTSNWELAKQTDGKVNHINWRRIYNRSKRKRMTERARECVYEREGGEGQNEVTHPKHVDAFHIDIEGMPCMAAG